MEAKTAAPAAIASAVVFVAVGYAAVTNTPTSSGPATTADSTTAPAATTSLDQLTVASDMPMTGYDRDHFGDWNSHGSGCDTREIVLREQAAPGTYRAGDACRADAGTWTSAYTGQTFTDSSDLDIDHVVPLAEAWRSGASAWTPEKQDAFANDLERPQLLAVDASSNRSKGDGDPSVWMPELDTCTYTRDWITVKSHYDLTVDPAERAALVDGLATCNTEGGAP